MDKEVKTRTQVALAKSSTREIQTSNNTLPLLNTSLTQAQTVVREYQPTANLGPAAAKQPTAAKHEKTKRVSNAQPKTTREANDSIAIAAKQ